MKSKRSIKHSVSVGPAHDHDPKDQKLSLTRKTRISCRLSTQPYESAKGSDKIPAPYICRGCSKPIKRDKFLLKACEEYWHENCLRCDRCHTRLGELGSVLYFKSNMRLCRQDYLEMFGRTGICSVCEKLICASEMVMRARENVYHLECFACQLCCQRFCIGDRFYLCENKVVCQYDYEEHILPIQQSYLTANHHPATDTSVPGAPELLAMRGDGVIDAGPQLGQSTLAVDDMSNVIPATNGGVGDNKAREEMQSEDDREQHDDPAESTKEDLNQDIITNIDSEKTDDEANVED